MFRLIILIAVFILALSFFGISIRTIVESPTGQDNLLFVWDLILTGWHIIVSYLAALWDFVSGIIFFWK